MYKNEKFSTKPGFGKPNRSEIVPKVKPIEETYIPPTNLDWKKCSTPGCGETPCISRPGYRKGAPICLGCSEQECRVNPVKPEFVSQ